MNLEVLIHFMPFASIGTFRHQPYVVVSASGTESNFYSNKSVKTVCLSTVFQCYSRVTEISAYMRLSQLRFSLFYIPLCPKSSITACLSLSHTSICIPVFVCLWLPLFFLFHFIPNSLFLLWVFFLTSSSFPLPLCNCVKVTEIGREIG